MTHARFFLVSPFRLVALLLLVALVAATPAVAQTVTYDLTTTSVMRINLPVSQAQSQTEQANDQYISALYQHNIAKLSLARALGAAQTNYKDYLGGK